MLAAGKLRETILIQENTGGNADAFNEPADNWGTITNGTQRAEVKDMIGRSYFSGQTPQSTVSAEVRCYYVSGVKAGMRVKVTSQSDRILHIVAPRADVRRRELILYCNEDSD